MRHIWVLQSLLQLVHRVHQYYIDDFIPAWTFLNSSMWLDNVLPKLARPSVGMESLDFLALSYPFFTIKTKSQILYSCVIQVLFSLQLFSMACILHFSLMSCQPTFAYWQRIMSIPTTICPVLQGTYEGTVVWMAYLVAGKIMSNCSQTLLRENVRCIVDYWEWDVFFQWWLELWDFWQLLVEL